MYVTVCLSTEASLNHFLLQVKRLYEMFMKVDCLQLEVNPLAETPEGLVYTADAKLGFDDNAKFRQKTIFEMEDTTELDPREVEATSFNLNYVQMEGNIGCLVNGAGLAMATMDIIKYYGGEPANFLDVGGSVQEHQVFFRFDSSLNLLPKDSSQVWWHVFISGEGGISHH